MSAGVETNHRETDQGNI